MNLSRSVFMHKYLNKKHSVSSLFLAIIIFCAFFLVLLLFLLFTQPQNSGDRHLLFPAVISGLIILIIGGLIMWPSQKNTEISTQIPSNQELDDKYSLNDLINEKKYFASVLSHDLRSPLSSIVLLASYLKSKEGLPDSGQYIELIEQSARKELEMMGTLLSLMRADVFNSDNVEEINLKSLTEEVTQSLEQHLSLKQLRVDFNIPSNASLTTDRQMLSFILKSLITQAIQFSQADQNLSIKAFEEKNRLIIELQIVSVELSRQVGEQLFRSENLFNNNGAKTFPDSIDLYFCRKAVLAQNGTIHVLNTENSPVCRFVLALDRQLPSDIA